MSLLDNYDGIFTNHLVDAAMEAADIHMAEEELAFEGKIKCGRACEGDDDVELDESDLQYILGEDDPDDDDDLEITPDAEEGCKGSCESFMASLAKGMALADESYEDDGTSDDAALESAINSIYAALEGKGEDDKDDTDKSDEEEDEDLEEDSKSKKEKDDDKSDEEEDDSDEDDSEDDSDSDEDETDDEDDKKSKSKKKDKKDDDDSEEDDDAEESFLDIFNRLI